MLPELAIVLTLIGLTAYVVLGGADFGAGFWDLTAGGAERGAPVRAMVKRGMSPVWEANHVWLIFVLVMLWTAFPEAFGSITSTLSIPLFLAALGIVLRGGAFALKGEAATIAEARALGATFALSSVAVPFFLGAAAGAIAAGKVPVGNAAGDEWSSWTGPIPLLVGLVAVATGAHLAAVFLGADSHRAGRPELVRAFRTRALGSGVVAGALAIAGLAVVKSEAPRLYDGLTSGAGLACVIASAVAGVTTLAFEWRERFELARYTAAAAVGAIVAGWGFAQEPYLLPPELTLEEAAAPDATLTALVVAAVVGMALLVPALAWLFRLALSGRLAYEDEPRP
ncbi:MAG TPA: cytochrome d ubiquinol oxidase subunit II [Thermoleophilaceae bacterium]|jgi:cytochrome d ubiquinol oxidase subunit II|nr:cytochrome d ubiquinol oxidase subunit II [Thermoleophilaceae bacterium]